MVHYWSGSYLNKAEIAIYAFLYFNRYCKTQMLQKSISKLVK